MPTLNADDDVKLYYEETGSGAPIVFAHEFAGDYRSWEPQVRHFSRRYRCIAFNARGYPPSEVPGNVESYSQNRARDDILSVLDALGIQRAHVVGNSMGGFAALHFGMAYSPRALSLVVAGCGYGAHPSQYQQFQEQAHSLAKSMLEEGMPKLASTYGHGPGRTQLKGKDPRGFAEFIRNFSEHSAQGSAYTQLGCQARRPSLYDLTAEMARIAAPVLIVAGDEDHALARAAEKALNAAKPVTLAAGQAEKIEIRVGSDHPGAAAGSKSAAGRQLTGTTLGAIGANWTAVGIFALVLAVGLVAFLVLRVREKARS
jgi:pimeloyl-ACP methyl ester carboxylesterase